MVADRGRNSSQGYALLTPTLAVMALALAAPLLLMAITSLKNQSGLGFADGWTLAHYGEVLGRASYRALFLRSVLISALVTLATVGLAYPMAYFVAFHAGQRKFSQHEREAIASWARATVVPDRLTLEE